MNFSLVSSLALALIVLTLAIVPSDTFAILATSARVFTGSIKFDNVVKVAPDCSPLRST
jgi:hypothetical protein